MAHLLSVRAGANLGRFLGFALAFALDKLSKRENPAPPNTPESGFLALTREDVLSSGLPDRAATRRGAGFFRAGDRTAHGENR